MDFYSPDYSKQTSTKGKKAQRYKDWKSTTVNAQRKEGDETQVELIRPITPVGNTQRYFKGKTR